MCDEQIKEWVCESVAGYGFSYGYKKLTEDLKREHRLIINKKKVYRLCKELNILKPQRKLKPRRPKRLSRNREITEPKQLWKTDIKYGHIDGEDRFFFILSYIDVYDRSIVNYYTGLHCEGRDAVQTLKRALLRRQLYKADSKPVIRSDNGPQYISKAFKDACSKLGIEHERIPCKTPNKNAHIESFHSLLQKECLDIYEFDTYGQGYKGVVEFMDRYNSRRIQSSIGYDTPSEFYAKCKRGKAGDMLVKV